MNFYYLDQTNNVAGPLSREQLQQLVDSDVLPTTTQVCNEGSEEWQPISTYIHRIKKPLATTRQAVSTSVATSVPSASPSSSASPLKVFAAVFLAIILAGGCLMAGWSLFLRDRGAKPFTISTKPGSESILERKGQLEGEVFVVTKGGQNYKLGLVPVALYPMETLQPHLDRKKSEADAASRELKPQIAAAEAEYQQAGVVSDAAYKAWMNFSGPNDDALKPVYEKAIQRTDATRKLQYDLHRQQENFLSGRYYFEGLPEPVVTTQTNSDGKFTIEVPTKGQFAVAATAHRSVGDSTERYYWLLKISSDGTGQKIIMLSNNNMTSEGSPDSLILTTY